jgi:hypothetical protein
VRASDGEGLDPYGIKEIVIEFDTSDEEVLKPKLRPRHLLGECRLWPKTDLRRSAAAPPNTPTYL